MAKALYRKYRPCSLSDVVGQEQVTDVLANSLKQDKVSHAYLFIGPRGTGKTSVARIFAHEVNGFKYEVEDDYVDIVEIDGASNRGVDNIRELREKVMIAPTSGKYKVYIIDEVHMLTKEAFNALLKTLEEPPKHVIFIMATTDAYKVPVTITSRAQTYTFKLADAGTMFGHLQKIAEAEGIKIDENALRAIAKRGGGSFRDSLSLLDQISTLSNDLITAELVNKAMGLPGDEKIQGLLSECVGRDIAKITGAMRELLATGIKPETIVEEMMTMIIENPQAEFLPILARLTSIKAPLSEFGEAKLLVALVGELSTPAVSAPRMITQSPAAPKSEVTPRVEAKKEPEIVRQARVAEEPKVQEVESPKINNSVVVDAGDFDWNKYLGAVESLNKTIHSWLSKCNYSAGGGELNIYPDKMIAHKILSNENNKKILIQVAGGLKVFVHEVGERPKNAEKDALLMKISDIMGGEVRNDGGENPF